jgi:hypothetical protein
MNLLQNIKWNGRSYPLEQHVSNHRTAVDDLNECSAHIGNAVPDMKQRVEYLLESLSCQDSSLQAAMGNIRADTNNMRNNFEAASAHLIEVDPYRRSSRQIQRPNRTANVSGVSFAGRGDTGVDLRWHTRKEFSELTSEQKDELTAWQGTKEGKKAIKDEKSPKKKRKKDDDAAGSNDNNNTSWKSKLKKKLKTQHGLSHVMSLLAEEEASNTALISGIQIQLPPPPASAPATAPTATPTATTSTAAVSALASAFPALSTKVKLNSILKNKK